MTIELVTDSETTWLHLRAPSGNRAMLNVGGNSIVLDVLREIVVASDHIVDANKMMPSPSAREAVEKCIEIFDTWQYEYGRIDAMRAYRDSLPGSQP